MTEKWDYRGEEWKGNLTHVHYKNGATSSRSEHYSTSTATTVLTSELADAKIIQLIAYSVKLPPVLLKTVADNLLVHQYALAKTSTGHLVMIEKLPSCILMQSCHGSDMPLGIFIRMRDGTRRKRCKTIKTIEKDPQPQDKTVKDIIEWIFESGELAERYNLFDSNCQQFVLNLWQRFSSLHFPNPAKYRETPLPMEPPEVNVANWQKKKSFFGSGHIGPMSCRTQG